MSIKLNRVPPQALNDMFSGNSKAYYEYTMNTLEEDIEESSLSTKKNVFKAICLSGGTTPSQTKAAGFMNGLDLVDFGDGVKRYAIKFRIVDFMYDSSNPAITDILPSPFAPGISEAEKQRRISLHPTAYTEIAGKNEQFFTFGTTIDVKVMGDAFLVKSIFGNAFSGQSVAGGMGQGINFNPEAGMPPVAQDIIKPPEFSVNGVRYVSVPALNAANRASALYKSALAAGMTDSSKAWETTPAGRAWVSRVIYDGLFPGKGKGAKYGPLLGTTSESFWSSWFHNMCHKPYKKAFGKKKGVYTYYGYPSTQAFQARQRIEANTASFIGQEFFCIFRSREAPIFPGDSLFNWGGHKNPHGVSSYEAMDGSASGTGSHMTVFARQDGNYGYFHGGNESQKVGNRKFSLKAGNYLDSKHHGKFIAVYKKVKVVGIG